MACLADDTLLNSVNSGNPNLDAKIREWLLFDKNAETFGQIKNFLLLSNYDELSKRLLNRMEFGTAGLRAALGAGYSCMNDLTVIQSTQGLCKYAQYQFEDIATRGVVIGHDARHGSYRFARLAASVFLHLGIKVYLFSDIVPTPFVPYAVLKYKAVVGIMVTASHNPKEDNGYKVYFDNGAQIVSPHDKGISEQIMLSLEPLATSWDSEFYKTCGHCIDPLDEVLACYMSDLQQHCYYRDINKASDLKITYTAMHGVGERYEVEAFKSFSLKPFITTEEQRLPDPDFPTVRYPNPEEGKNSLDLAIKTAEKNGSPFIIANDPDADRLAIAEKLPNGSWKVFTGNETGMLLGWWAFENHKALYPDLYPGDSVYMLYSTVSSHILRSMGQAEGFLVEETLTGFKWMGNRAHELKAANKHVIFAFEEAIGFMYGTHVLDKDGISAGVILAELATFLHHAGVTVAEQVQNLYEKYGIHLSNNSYFLCYCSATIKRIFDRIRTMEDGKYPSKLGPYDILAVRDLTGAGYDSSQPDKKPIFPTSKSSQMITFQFSGGMVATIRTSGTEPKIKFYSEIICRKDDRITQEQARANIDHLISLLIDLWLEPGKNNLERQSSS